MGDVWDPTELTSGRRPVLVIGESILLVQKDVGLYDGQAYVTSHRILWIDDTSQALARSLSLKDVQSVNNTGGFSMSGVIPAASSFLKSSPKIVLTVQRTISPSSIPSLNSINPNPSHATQQSNKPTIPDASWICTICDHPNTTSRSKCDECGVIRAKDAKLSNSSPPVPVPQTPPSSSTSSCPICTFVNHPDMVTCEMCESPLQPPKSSISSTTSSTSSLKMESVPEKIVKLSFRSGGLNEFLKVLKSALTEKAWEKKIESPTATTPSAAMAAAGSSAGGGISRIMKAADLEKKERDTSLSDAFRDIDSLMAKASQMVKLAESINAKMANPTATSDSSSDQVNAFRSYLVELGISSPVTREGTGNLYIRELSRELAEFLSKILNSRRTMIPLVDLYCMMNRARGVSLVSPSDLLQSCQTLQTLSLPFRLRKFDRSGLLVVESADPRMGGDDAVADRVAEVIKASTIFVEKGINAFEVAEVEGVSVVMAVEMLNIAESCGRVCRDDTIEGLRFYDNIIDSFLLDSSSTLFQPGSRKGLEFS